MIKIFKIFKKKKKKKQLETEYYDSFHIDNNEIEKKSKRSFFSKKNKKKNPKNKLKELRKKNKIKDIQKKRFQIRNFKKKLPIISFILLIILVFGGVYLYFIQNREDWVLQETEYVGLKNLSKKELDNEINEYFSKLIFQVDTDDVEKKILDTFIEVNTIRSEKIYPNKIIFYLEEKDLAFILVGFNGVFLIDINGEVIKGINNYDQIHFIAEDYNIARGFGDINAEYIEDKVFETIAEENVEDFNFDLVDISIKEQILEDITIQRRIKFDNILNKTAEKLIVFENYDLPIIFTWEERQWEVEEYIDNNRVDFFVEIIQTIQADFGFDIEKYLWDGDQRFFIEINGDIEIITSPIREAKTQLEDLQILSKSEGFEYDKIKKIDLSSTKILVEYK